MIIVITIINFSASRDANCIKIANFIENMMPKKEVKIFNFHEINLLPCGYCEYECVKKGDHCRANDKLIEIYETISKSEEAIFILPNYRDYPCANFFIFNERGTGYYSCDIEKREKYKAVKKKFIVLSNSTGENFKKAFSYHVKSEPDILFLGAKKVGISALDKNMADKEGIRKLIKNFIKEKYRIERSAMAVVIWKEKILCTEEEIYGVPCLSLPKGHIEKGETVLKAAIRECYEETNVVIKESDLVEYLDSYEVVFTNHYFDIVKKIIYPVLFVVKEQGEPKSKEERIKKVEFMNVGGFLLSCSYDNIIEVAQKVILKLSGNNNKIL